MGKFTHLSEEVSELYYRGRSILVTRGEPFQTLTVKPYEKRAEEELEQTLKKRMRKDGRQDLIPLRDRVRKYRDKKWMKKEIWLIMDRVDVAGDNGEVFFSYMTKEHKKEACYFVIQKDCRDHERMETYGKVLDFGSDAHKEMLLKAKYFVTSQGEDLLLNPLGEDGKYLKDLLQYKYVFLQHGIIKDDLSGWLHEANKNVHMFVTSAKKEYESIVQGQYDYGENVVKLTGLPRYDRLKQEKEPEKSVLILPTWRTGLAGKLDPVTGLRTKGKDFTQSKYYEFYQSLISDEKLLAAMKEFGYRGVLALHTRMWEEAGAFQGNDVFTVVGEGMNYREQFLKNRFMVTDYSSTFFDFGYLKKPIIYAQFDREDFYKNQIYDAGYFSYEEDGFGPVCRTVSQTVDAMIDLLKKDGKIDIKYAQRQEKWYAYQDAEHCHRIYEEIRKL